MCGFGVGGVLLLGWFLLVGDLVVSFGFGLCVYLAGQTLMFKVFGVAGCVCGCWYWWFVLGLVV